MQFFPLRRTTVASLFPKPVATLYYYHRKWRDPLTLTTSTTRQATTQTSVDDTYEERIETIDTSQQISCGSIATESSTSQMDNNNKASFRRIRKKMAQQLLIEYDRTAFGELLLQQPTPTPTSPLTFSSHHNRDTVLPDVPSPNVTIRWSNRLRTTAGRAHLMLLNTPRKGGKKLSMNGLNIPIESQQSITGVNKSLIPLDCVTGEDTGHVLVPTSHAIPVSQSLPPQGARRTAVVELSTKVIDDELRLRTTLLHELCHVAAWIVDGNVKPPHGPCFQKWVTIVTNAIQPTIPIPTKHNFEIHYKYSWECTNPSCSDTLIQRHSRRSIDIQRHVCAQCRSPLREVDHHHHRRRQQQPPLSTSSDGIEHINNNAALTHQTPITTRRPLSDYNRFIQKHAKIVTKRLQQQQHQRSGKLPAKKRSKTISPQKVMKACAKLWQKHKKTLIK